METVNINLILLEEAIDAPKPVVAKEKIAEAPLVASYLLLTQAQEASRGVTQGAERSVQAAAATSVSASPTKKKLSMPPMPMPNMPPSGAPSPALPTGGSASTMGVNGYADKLEQIFEYISNHPSDPSGPLNLMAYLVNLQSAGVLNDPSVQSILAAWNNSGIIQFAMEMGAMYAFFFGYTPPGGSKETGGQGMNDYITAVLSALSQGTSNPTIADMYNTLNSWNSTYGGVNGKFAQAHTNDSGGLYWLYNGVTYNWGSTTGDDSFFIEQLIATAGGDPTYGGDPSYGTYFSALDNNDGTNLAERDYRMAALQQLLAEFKNPEIVISLWIMMAYDTEFQGQEGGLADTTNYLSNVTNNYATPLESIAQGINGAPGQGITATQASQFVYDLYNATNLVGMLPQTASFANQWQTNVFNMLGGIQVQYAGSTVSLGGMMSNFLTGQVSPNDMAMVLNNLNPVPTSPSSSSVNPGYQTLINALTQGGALVTGTSKTVSTMLSTVANVDDQVVKLGSALTSATGGGFVQLILGIVQNQISH